MEPTPEFKTAFGLFIEASQRIIDAYWVKMGFTHAMPPLLVIEYKNRFVKVWRRDRNKEGIVSTYGSIHCFVDMVGGDVKGKIGKVGDIYKPAGCNGPTKNARGNIFAEDHGASCMTEHGTVYLRG